MSGLSVMRHERMLNRKQTTLTIVAALLGAAGGYYLWDVLERTDPASSSVWKVVLPGLAFLLCAAAVNSIPSAMTLDADGIIGSKGVAVTEVGAQGQIRLGAELWTAFSATGEVIPVGTEVVVSASKGLIVEVVRAA